MHRGAVGFDGLRIVGDGRFSGRRRHLSGGRRWLELGLLTFGSAASKVLDLRQQRPSGRRCRRSERRLGDVEVLRDFRHPSFGVRDASGLRVEGVEGFEQMPTADGLRCRRFWAGSVEALRNLGVESSGREASMAGGGRRQMPTANGLRCRRFWAGGVEALWNLGVESSGPEMSMAGGGRRQSLR
jgi:hypothetical protein